MEPAVVSRIIDGDTLEIRGTASGSLLAQREAATVRLLEIDTPETKDPSQPVQCYGVEATEYLSEIAPVGATVWVLRDKELFDPYGLHLLYVWVDNVDGVTFVNEAMVASGHATAVLYEPNDRYIVRMRRAERQARVASVGMWGECASTGGSGGAQNAPVSEPRRRIGVGSAGCDSSYPGVCIPSGPDLDCSEVPFTDFRVLSPDPHGFDADGDGLGCVT